MLQWKDLNLFDSNKQGNLQSKVSENINGGLNYYFSWEVKKFLSFIWLSHTWTTMTVWNRGLFSGLGIKMFAGSHWLYYRGQLWYGGRLHWRKLYLGVKWTLCSMETSYEKLMLKKVIYLCTSSGTPGRSKKQNKQTKTTRTDKLSEEIPPYPQWQRFAQKTYGRWIYIPKL